MEKRTTYAFGLLLVLGLCFTLGSLAGKASPQEIRNVPYIPLIQDVSYAPAVVAAGGQYHLIYELHLTSVFGRDLTLRRLEIMNSRNAAVKAYDGKELFRCLVRPGRQPDPEEKGVLGSGARAVAFLMLSFGDSAQIPDALIHRVTVVYARPNGEQVVLQGDSRPFPVSRKEAVVIGPPVRPGVWLAGNGPGDGPVGHRLSMQAWNGRLVVNQRYALDFMKFGEDNRLVRGENAANPNWTSYGQEILAVADGEVVEIKDGVVENTPGEKYAVPNTLENAAGNFIVLKIGSDAFAAYSHLQPKSLRVKAGDRVRKGQVLGLIGNSGISDAPHLHFHVIDAASFFGGESVPYVFEEFELLGPFLNLDENIDKSWVPQGPAGKRRKEILLGDHVIRILQEFAR